MFFVKYLMCSGEKKCFLHIPAEKQMPWLAHSWEARKPGDPVLSFKFLIYKKMEK